MAEHQLRRRVASGRAARLAALPVRASTVAKADGKLLKESIRWLATSREHTNFTYDLTPLNLEHLAWYVANLTGVPVGRIREYMAELQEDEGLRAHVGSLTAASPRRGLADSVARYGRRLGWYAIVRAMQPALVVETGTDKGLGSVVLASALMRNGEGRLITLDINPESGYLIEGTYAAWVDRWIGDSIDALASIDSTVDIFLHDSDHSTDHERRELVAVEPHLGPESIVLSDNSHCTAVLSEWAESREWRFSFFKEVPEHHWWPGDGIGAARRSTLAASATAAPRE